VPVTSKDGHENEELDEQIEYIYEDKNLSDDDLPTFHDYD